MSAANQNGASVNISQQQPAMGMGMMGMQQQQQPAMGMGMMGMQQQQPFFQASSTGAPGGSQIPMTKTPPAQDDSFSSLVGDLLK